jgi:hypothetical protein
VTTRRTLRAAAYSWSLPWQPSPRFTASACKKAQMRGHSRDILQMDSASRCPGAGAQLRHPWTQIRANYHTVATFRLRIGRRPARSATTRRCWPRAMPGSTNRFIPRLLRLREMRPVRGMRSLTLIYRRIAAEPKTEMPPTSRRLVGENPQFPTKTRRRTESF